MNAAAIFAALVVYLEANGWYRDGDDFGIWRHDGWGPVGFGDAVQIQLEADWINMQDTP
jgi:hypothetical protein